MNDQKFLPDDPKLTAYALGELDGAERAAVEAALRDDPAARAAVEEIRAMGVQLEGALAVEATTEGSNKKPASPSSSHARAAIIPGKDFSKLDGGPLDALNGHSSPLAKVIKFPQFYYVAAGLAAACFAVMVALRTPRPVPAPQKIYTQIDLTSLPGATPIGSAEEKEPLTDAAVPALPGTPMASSPIFNGNLSLLGQAKDLESGKVGDGALPGQTFPSSVMKTESLSKLTARNEPLVIKGAPGEVAARVSERPREVRAQRASATQTYPADDKMLVNAQPKPAAKAAASTPAVSALEQASRQADALKFGGAGPTFSSKESIALGATGGAIALNSRDGAIFSENRGLTGSVSADLDRVAPRENTPAPASADRYAEVKDNDFLGAKDNPLSTFAIDVDTASYANIRRFLRGHQRPPRDAVRIEELVNYFPYRYAPPPTAKRDAGVGSAGTSPATAVPFAASLEVAEAPWAPTHRLVRIGLKGREVSTAARPAANLVFLLDVSGSMSAPNRLPLVKESMRLLVGKLRPDDRVAIVTYAGQSGLALASTPVSHAKEILEALDSLSAAGSTNGGMGIQLAYDIAKANFATGGINRVILCTDGDFNVGVTGEGELARLIEEKAKSGVALTALGFGMGNLKDATLEKLADHGNGNYGYIDSRREAEKLLVEQVNGTLLTIAKDVKIQVEFNPARVASYRLIGYENRVLKKEDFNNDAIDGGEIGVGHTVTAFYEIVPVGVDDKSAVSGPAVDELKYAWVENPKSKIENQKFLGELLTVKLRYKEPAADVSQKIEFPFTDGGAKFVNASTDFKFAAAVASFGMILRESPHKGTATMADVVTWAEAGTTDDAGGYRAEFVELAREAEKIER